VGDSVEHKNILLLTAMDNEFKDCLEKETFTTTKVSAFGIDIFKSETKGKTIYIAKTGVGPINAAATTALILDQIKIDLVLLLGLGGALDTRLELGDVCIGTHVIQHDAICSYDDRVEQMACGELHLSLKPNERPDIKIPTSHFINERVGGYLKEKGFNVLAGDILSGSEFNASLDKKKQMKERFKNATLVEMEACSVGLICKKLGVHFSVIKTVADTATNAPDKEYKDFINSSAKKCADVFDFVRAL
jgi:5'-methylthioadenosine/S-adenosylhomocysteine nucleosidase